MLIIIEDFIVKIIKLKKKILNLFNKFLFKKFTSCEQNI